MEELQSTEVLEREILEDARKKSLRILNNAEDTISAKNKDWEKKTGFSIAEIKNNYSELRDISTEKVMARLPIDKLRTKVEKIDGFIQEAVENWYINTSKERIMELLIAELSKRIEVCKGIGTAGKKKAFYSCMERADALSVLSKAGLNSFAEDDPEELKDKNRYPSVIIETDNTRIIASIQNMVNNCLENKREELVASLVGRDFMEHY